MQLKAYLKIPAKEIWTSFSVITFCPQMVKKGLFKKYLTKNNSNIINSCDGLTIFKY